MFTRKGRIELSSFGAIMSVSVGSSRAAAGRTAMAEGSTVVASDCGRTVVWLMVALLV
jgi:hypothetical protein